MPDDKLWTLNSGRWTPDDELQTMNSGLSRPFRGLGERRKHKTILVYGLNYTLFILKQHYIFIGAGAPKHKARRKFLEKQRLHHCRVQSGRQTVDDELQMTNTRTWTPDDKHRMLNSGWRTLEGVLRTTNSGQTLKNRWPTFGKTYHTVITAMLLIVLCCIYLYIMKKKFGWPVFQFT